MYFGQTAEDLDDVLRFETDGHGGVERVFGETVLVDECRTARRISRVAVSRQKT